MLKNLIQYFYPPTIDTITTTHDSTLVRPFVCVSTAFKYSCPSDGEMMSCGVSKLLAELLSEEKDTIMRQTLSKAQLLTKKWIFDGGLGIVEQKIGMDVKDNFITVIKLILIYFFFNNNDNNIYDL